jgi:hypothetical protein
MAGGLRTFEVNCFDQLCEFVRLHFEDLIDRYYRDAHQASHEFPEWAFERYLRKSIDDLGQNSG